ncbi:N,N-dimethylformamidase beta subunit family domain-containing protein [Amycolatopsis sp. NPDC059657]|uniref:N,N-dimethylformamidase beta subunit family domain-containing protein n=1 Tax=Amycolatopsis sp. NPDC059657 TaxID=3346899 RepID=UPI00366E4098
MGKRAVTTYSKVLADGAAYTITLDTPALAGSRLVVAAGGGSIITAAKLENSSGTLFDKRTAAYTTGNNDVSIWDIIVPSGGCIAVYLTVNGADQNNGAIYELTDSPSYIDANRSGGGSGDTIDATTEYLARSAAGAVVPSGKTAHVIGVWTVEATLSGKPYSNPANRWTQMEPSGVLAAQAANQPGSGTEFIYASGIADAGPGTYRGASTFHNAPGNRFYTAVAAYENTGAPANATVSPVVQENRRPGTPRAKWFPGTIGYNATVSGYTDKQSYQAGDTVAFKVDSANLAFNVQIFRLGHYGHEEVGARNISGPGGVIAGTPAVQPAPSVDGTLGHTTCAWSTTASWTIPAGTPSGVYLYQLQRTDNAANMAYGHFVVRDTAVTGKIAVIVPDSTYQAYNIWGGPGDNGPRTVGNVWTGRSLYQIGGDLGVPNFSHRGYAVSWDRPLATGKTHPNTYMFDGDQPLWLFLEAQGYDLTYLSDTDLEANPTTALAGAALVMPIGHMEYVTEGMWNALRSAETSGINVLSHGANNALWRTRMPDSRTMICYKDSGTVDDSAGFTGTGRDPVAYTGTWRDTRGIVNLDPRAEAILFGQMFVANAPANKQLGVPYASKGLPLWRNSATVQALTTGQTYTTPTAVYGDEGDFVDARFPASPTNLVQLCPTVVSLSSGSNVNGSVYVTPYTNITIGFTLFRDPSGALVFHSGSWRGFEGVSRWARNDYAATISTPNVDWQNMVNAILYDLGARPATVRPLRLEDTALADPATGAPAGPRDAIAAAYGLIVSSAYVGWGIPI